MIYTLTLNPSIDYYLYKQDIVVGKTNRITKTEISLGGKGINISKILTALNIESIALGFIGNNASCCSDINIKTDFVNIIDNTRINVKVISQKETELNAIGPNITNDEIIKLFKKLDQINDGDFLIISGSIPQGLNENIYADILEYLKDRQVKIIVDSTQKLLLNTLKYHPLLIKPNLDELNELFSSNLVIEEKISFLQNLGAQNIIVSMGNQGAILYDINGIKMQTPPFKGIIKNTIGAGDALIAGFIKEYINSSNVVKAYLYGVSTAYAKCMGEVINEMNVNNIYQQLLKDTNKNSMDY
jgi:1-phosphofructokinase